MLLSLDDILKDAQIHVKDSAYARDSERLLRWGITSNNFFEVVQDAKESEIYEELWQVQPQKSDWNGKKKMFYLQFDEIQKRLKELKNKEEDLTHVHADEIKELRKQKKEIREAMHLQETTPTKYWFVKFKNCLYAMSFSTIGNYIPKMKNISFRCLEKMPLFTAGFSQLKKATEEGQPIAVTGGPCLFGVNEVSVVLEKKNGTRDVYDFSSGENAQYAIHAKGLAEALQDAKDEIINISVVNHKKGITSQEYDSIQCLFECAQAVNARLTIPLPDMSYIKYFRNITQNLPQEVAEEGLQKFRQVSFEICDMYLRLIDVFQKEYLGVEVAVIHERDTELCRRFYEGREPFLDNRLVRNLSNIPWKADSILDYITMPALPYYLWGITDIIQMDSLDEADSYRKSCKLHKGTVQIYAMLYPERLSKDGKHTIFYAPLEYKEYL